METTLCFVSHRVRSSAGRQCMQHCPGAAAVTEGAATARRGAVGAASGDMSTPVRKIRGEQNAAALLEVAGWGTDWVMTGPLDALAGAAPLVFRVETV